MGDRLLVRPVAGLLAILFLASCSRADSGPAADPERDAMLREISSRVQPPTAAEPQPQELSAVQGWVVEVLLLASRRNQGNVTTSKMCADLIGAVVEHPAQGRVRAYDEIRWVKYDGKQLRVHVPEKVASIFCEGNNVYVLGEAQADVTMVYRFTRDARYIDGMEISMAGMRASHTPGDVVSVFLDDDRLLLLWSASDECKSAADPTCWPYSVRWSSQ